MKDKFPGYYQMPKGDFDRMWKEGIFVFDANFLLDLFRYSDETAKSLLNTLNKIKDRIWIPYQSAHEYHENLYGVIEKAAKSYDDAIGDIISLEKKFETKREHPFLEETFLREVKSFFERIKKALEEKKEKIISLLLTNPIKEELSDLLKDKLGEEFFQNQLEEIYKEGEKRYRLKIPPGYSDAKKEPEIKRYGDLILWKQILEKAGRIDSAIIFITGDMKEDWFSEKLGKKIGPRPELVAEIKKVKNIPFHIYPTHQFLEYANKYLLARVKNEALKEVKELEEQTRKERKMKSPIFNLEEEIAKYSTFSLADNIKRAEIAKRYAPTWAEIARRSPDIKLAEIMATSYSPTWAEIARLSPDIKLAEIMATSYSPTLPELVEKARPSRESKEDKK